MVETIFWQGKPVQTGLNRFSLSAWHFNARLPVIRTALTCTLYCFAALLVAACATLPPPSSSMSTPAEPRPTPLTFASAPAEQAIPRLILAERAAARTGDLALLAQLWAEEGRVIDGRTTADPADDYRWLGRDAILDRYVVAVFPNPPPALDHVAALTLDVTGSQAVAIHAGDHWQFVQQDGRWWILELAYSQ
jgi:hypothetical protein